MTDIERALEALKPALRRVYRAIEEHGPIPQSFLRQDRDLPDGEKWKGRADGMTVELTALQEAGLIRVVRTEKRGGPPTRIYDTVPEGEVAKAAASFKRTETKRLNKLRDNGAGGHTPRLKHYRKLEKAAGDSARAFWIERRRRIVELAADLRRVEPMLFWKAVPKDEIEQVYDEIVDLRIWASKLEASLDLNRVDKEARERIQKLRNTKGRTLEEADTARKLADKLEAKLDNGGNADAA